MISHALTDYDPLLIAASYLVAMLGAAVGLFAGQYVRDESGRLRLLWTIAAAIIIAGCMMWTAHFVGMLAYQPGVPVTFDLRMTWLSLLMPLIFAAIAVLIVTRHPHSHAVLVVGAVTMTMGLVALHYGGVAALRMPAEIVHRPFWVVVSILLAFVTSTAALFVTARVRGRPRYLAVPLMALAVCAMHFTGMAGIDPRPTPDEVQYFEGALTPGMLATVVLTATSTVILLGILLGLAGHLDRAMDRSRARRELG